ncbi:MAG TPA: alpha-amylase family glycosyl hydrolase [Puia sp.]
MTAPFYHADWIHTTNIYEVNLRQYTREGTFAAFAREMPRLRDMGIEVLWFMPITPISVEKRKGTLGSYYACSDYTSINPEFGSLDDFKQLVRSAHEMGFRVIIDWVVNHTGWDHHWTREHPDFYRKNHDGQFFEAHGWEDVIDLNYDNPALRQAVIEAMRFWVREADIDGFRCDMAMLVPLEFWREARTELDKMKKELFWLAECEEIAYHEVFDATYTWKFLHKMEAVWKKESGLGGLDEVLQYYDTMFPPDAIRAFFTSNHDENSHSGSEYERMGDAAKAFAVLCCTGSGLPLIYSGQELPNLKRLLFFEKDFIEWTGGAGPGDPAEWAASCALHDFYKTMLALRKRNPALRVADPSATTHRLHTRADDRSFVFARRAGENEVLVALNFSAEPLSLATEELLLNGGFQNVFTGEGVDFGPGKTIGLAPWGYGVFEKK